MWDRKQLDADGVLVIPHAGSFTARSAYAATQELLRSHAARNKATRTLEMGFSVRLRAFVTPWSNFFGVTDWVSAVWIGRAARYEPIPLPSVTT